MVSVRAGRVYDAKCCTEKFGVSPHLSGKSATGAKER